VRNNFIAADFWQTFSAVNWRQLTGLARKKHVFSISYISLFTISSDF